MDKLRTKKQSQKKGSVRIIGGDFRGRKLPVLSLDGLRPTADRVRETLFNWLQFDVANSKCLDVFSGSGSLGFEALSRRADKVVFLEESSTIAVQLKHNIKLLQLSPARAEVKVTDSLKFLQATPPRQPFDIVFIDPPFNLNLMQLTVDLLFKNTWINSHGWLYLEQENSLDWPILSKNWICYREKSTSQVKYGLFRQKENY